MFSHSRIRKEKNLYNELSKEELVEEFVKETNIKNKLYSSC